MDRNNAGTLDEIIAEKVALIMRDERKRAHDELTATFKAIFNTILQMDRHGPNDMLNEKEVAAYLGISISTLQAWRQRKEVLPYVKIRGKAVRYRFKDVLELVERRRVKVWDDGRER